MCEPTTIMTTLAIASAVSGVYGQKQQADYTEKMNDRQTDEAMRAMAENNNQINYAQEQQRQQASSQIAQNNKAARQAFSTAQVSAGESGVSGLSVDALLGEILGQQSTFNESVKQNYMGQVMANEASRKNVYAQTSSMINSLPPVIPPDYLGAALQIGSAGVQGYSGMSTYMSDGRSATTTTDTNYASVPNAYPYASSIGSRAR